MKKIILFLLLILSISANADIYTGFGGSLGFSTYKLFDSYDANNLNTTSVNLNFSSHAGNNIAAINEMNIGWIFAANTTDENNQSISVIQDYPVSIAFNLLYGLGTIIEINNFLKCELGFGLDANMNILLNITSIDPRYTSMDFGIGGVCSIFYSLSKKSMLKLGVTCAYNPINAYLILGDQNTGFKNSLHIYPTIVLLRHIA
ncbi:MAG: hypothetical protein JXR48_11165 [Candidatus Delongbacteria bacterium]|nr:hypothetical protein [Candidatus Delongbacteria bacterium]